MSVRRALVDCAVLSLQDSCVYYPCCKCCFSRIDVEQRDTARCRCSKCGYSCLRDQVDYRYRLSLKVARDRCIFGVTVFGTCLNPFFGVHASGLQRLVDNSDGPVGASARSRLLVKAVEDCFIGRHFIFGIKVTGTERELWSGGHVANGSCSRDPVQFIASQMILPKATGLAGCTVVSYYRVLLQKAEEHELGSSSDTSKTYRPPATTLLLIPLHSPTGTFNNTALSASGLLSQSLQRSQHQDCAPTPTPPWQQSLGLVTSSAEQDEGCSTQNSGCENRRQTGHSKTPRQVLRNCLENHNFTAETTLSPSLSYNSLSFSTYPDFSIEKSIVNTPTPDTWFSPSQSVKKSLPLGSNTREFSSTQLNELFPSSSLAWDDLPFSESLTEFLCDKDKATETDTHQNVKDTARNNLEIRSQDKESKAHVPVKQLLVDITNTPEPNYGVDRDDLSDSVCKNPVASVNDSKARSFSSSECNRHNVEVGSLEEEQLERDTYNCSADLFSSSLVSNMNTTIFNTHTETARMDPNDPHSTPDTQKLRSNECINKNSLISSVPQELDFIPPSQSTPNVKLAIVPQSFCSSRVGEFGLQLASQDLCAFNGNLYELESKNTATSTSPLCNLNTVSTNQLSLCARVSTKDNLALGMRSTTSTRRSHRFTPKRRFRKPDKHQQHLLTQQCRGFLREALNHERIEHKCDSSFYDVSVCDYEDNEVPPTPKTRLSAKLRRRQLTDNSSSDYGSACEGQKGDGLNCKASLLHPSLTSLQRRLAQTGNCDSEVVDPGSLDGPNGYTLDDENQACDWSRDLFSDSL